MGTNLIFKLRMSLVHLYYTQHEHMAPLSMMYHGILEGKSKTIRDLFWGSQV